MGKVRYIIDLANGNLSFEGYKYITLIVRHLINNFNWPKVILDESINNNDHYWTDEEVLSFTQQLLTFIIKKRKLKKYYKVPNEYLEYYFKSIIVTYAANKIKENQKLFGISYSDTNRISLEILKEKYFNKVINKIIIWNREDIFENPVLNDEDINHIVGLLPKIPITENTKHYKPRVKTAIKDLFSIINRPIAQKVIINQVYLLFDQSSFAIEFHDEQQDFIVRRQFISKSVKLIINKLSKTDIPIYKDYFFSEKTISLSSLAKTYNLPKSTIHYKLKQFKKIITANFIPDNEQEGIFFLEKLHEILDGLS